MAMHTANTMEASPGLKPRKARGLIIHPSDELDCALDDYFEQMSKRYTPKNTEASISLAQKTFWEWMKVKERCLAFSMTEEPCLKQ